MYHIYLLFIIEKCRIHDFHGNYSWRWQNYQDFHNTRRLCMGDIARNVPALNNMIGCKITSVKHIPRYGSIRDDRPPYSNCYQSSLLSFKGLQG